MPSIRKLTETGQAESVSRQVLALSCKKKKIRIEIPGYHPCPGMSIVQKKKKKDYMQMRSVSADDDNSITKTKLLPIGV